MRTSERAVNIPIGKITLHGDLSVPPEPRGLVLFAHGSGSSRRSPRNRFVAAVLQEAGMATLLFDLLTEAEERVDERTAELRFDIGLLASRLRAATEWIRAFDNFGPSGRVTPDKFPIGYFGLPPALPRRSLPPLATPTSPPLFRAVGVPIWRVTLSP